jgi:hypothetical protein
MNHMFNFNEEFFWDKNSRLIGPKYKEFSKIVKNKLGISIDKPKYIDKSDMYIFDILGGYDPTKLSKSNIHYAVSVFLDLPSVILYIHNKVTNVLLKRKFSDFESAIDFIVSHKS